MSPFLNYLNKQKPLQMLIFNYFKDKLIKFPTYRQTEAKDCGATCIKILAKHYGKLINTQELRNPVLNICYI